MKSMASFDNDVRNGGTSLGFNFGPFVIEVEIRLLRFRQCLGFWRNSVVHVPKHPLVRLQGAQLQHPV